MSLWTIEFLIALASSFVAVVIGSGGDILFLSSVIFVVPLFLHLPQNMFNLGPLVVVQGVIATLIGGVAYAQVTKISLRLTVEALACVMVGSASSSVVAYLLPSITLRLILALATTVGVVQVFSKRKQNANSIRPSSVGLNKRLLLLVFGVSAITGGLGIGGGFLFFIVLRRTTLPLRQIRGLTLLLTSMNLISSFVIHVMTISINFGDLGYIALGALTGSIIAVKFIRHLDERVALWGLRLLLVGSAVMSWLALLPFLRLL